MNLSMILTVAGVAILAIATTAFSAHRAGWSQPAVIALSLFSGLAIAAMVAGT